MVEDAAVAEELEPEAVEQVETDTIEEEVEIESEEAETGEASENEPSESSTEKKGDSFQDRIDEVTGKFRTEERARMLSEQNVQGLKQQIEDLEQKLQPEPVVPGKTLADFEYDESAFTRYVGDLARQDAQAAVRQQTQQTQAQQKHSAFALKEAELAKEVPDYYAVSHYSPISPQVADTLMAADKGPEIAYYLGKNPDIATRLSNMSPVNMAMELGRIEATQLSKPEKSTTETPTPVPKIQGAAKSDKVSATDPAGDKLSDKEWLKRRNKQVDAR